MAVADAQKSLQEARQQASYWASELQFQAAAADIIAFPFVTIGYIFGFLWFAVKYFFGLIKFGFRSGARSS